MSNSIQRRDALKKLGALAISAPALASMACNEDEGTDAGMNMGPVTGNPDGGIPSGMPDGGGLGGIDSSTNPTGGGTGGGSPGGASDGAVGSADAAADAAGPTGGDAAVPGGNGFLPPNFEDAPTCEVTLTDPAGEGPFFIHENEVMTDPSIVRVDMREGRPGVELQLNLRVLDMDGQCMTPIKDVEIYVWHTDALGLYSGFACQNPDKAYVPGPTTPANNERFCRGVQITDANGVVSFRSVYPGWYYGRYVHIHFVALRRGSGASDNGMDPSYRSAKYHMFTTQMYFDETFSKNIHENNAPYTMRTNTNGYSTYIKADPVSKVLPQVRMEGNIAVASLNIITNSKQSRGGGGGIGGFFGGLGAGECPGS
jgi:protocatechuate 3,4-dioxygenase beta subunit